MRRDSTIQATLQWTTKQLDGQCGSYSHQRSTPTPQLNQHLKCTRHQELAKLAVQPSYQIHSQTRSGNPSGSPFPPLHQGSERAALLSKCLHTVTHIPDNVKFAFPLFYRPEALSFLITLTSYCSRNFKNTSGICLVSKPCQHLTRKSEHQNISLQSLFLSFIF